MDLFTGSYIEFYCTTTVSWDDICCGSHLYLDDVYKLCFEGNSEFPIDEKGILKMFMILSKEIPDIAAITSKGNTEYYWIGNKKFFNITDKFHYKNRSEDCNVEENVNKENIDDEFCD